MSRIWQWFTLVVLVGGVAVSVAVVPVDPFDEPTMAALAETQATIEDRQPEPFTLATPEGEIVPSASLSGRPVYLSFWAEWCDICKAEMPSLDAFARANQGRVEVLVVATDDNAAAALQWLDRTFPDQPAFRVLLDPGARVAHDVFRTTGVPETFVLDPRGRLIARYVGGYDFTQPQHARLASEVARP